jgi:hypothetical protein
MRRILFQQTDFNSLPNPPAGFNYIGFDGPNFSEKGEDGQVNQNVGPTGPTGPTGTGGSASSDRIISSNETYNMELILDDKGTINIPLLLPVSFTATCDATHYDGTASFTDSDLWEFEVEFQVGPDGTVQTMMNSIFPILTNPGYVSGDVFIFTESDHGIPGFNFELQLNNVEQAGPAGWTANVAVTQPPVYPSTLESSGAIKFTSNDNSLVLTTNGDLILPEGGDIKDINGNSVLSSVVLDVTYSELVYMIDEGELTTGKFYKITDFKTCYDQPDYNLFGNAITTGNYKEAEEVSPIIVFATSENTLSTDAYQPKYPKDKIKYDITFNVTEVTGNPAFGRITERIDEFNNRTDYDHRTVLFKRYDNYYYKENNIAEGTIELIENTGEVIGTETVFLNYNPGDHIAINTNVIFFEIVSIESNTSMIVTGLTIPAVSPGSSFYLAQRGGLTYKQNNISIEYTEHPTFLFGDEDIISNYIGDVAIFRNWSEHYFLLPNNVFREDVIGNRIGNEFINNTFNSDVEHNVIGDEFENNTIYNDEDFTDNQIATNFRNNLIICDDFNDNVIGDGFSNNKFFNNNDFVDNQIGIGFNDNTIYDDFEDNKIGNGFSYNVIDGSFYNNSIGNQFNNNDTYQDFDDNSIGHYFDGNTIYSNFYRNEILNNFNNNLIGDSVNLGNFEFYRNRIGNDFYENTIRQYFQNNQIGNQYNNNVVNGDFCKNVIGNGFNNNPNIGYDFYGNNIGNEFNNNELIGDYFKENQIGENFEDNYITSNFRGNSIGNLFENNTLGDTQYFTWDDTTIENLTARNYMTFYNSLYGDEGENIGNVILGKELIMHFSRNSGTIINSGDLIIGETYEITNYLGTDDFTDVADIITGEINTNGCVFIATGITVSNWSSQSELTELTSYDEYHLVKFTQWTQNNNGGGFSYERTKVYPTSEPTVYFTKLNYNTEVDLVIPGRFEIKRDDNGGIYNYITEESWDKNISPQGTEWNSIYTQDEYYFSNNEIQNEFKGNLILRGFSINKIGFGFSGNILHDEFVSNTTGGFFYSNDVNSFYSNKVGDEFWGNTIGDNFSYNEVGNWFGSNNISSNFRNNTIGKSFQNNTIAADFGFGESESQNNIIGDYFQENTIGEYFYNNKVASYFENNTVGYFFQRNNIDTEIYGEDFIINYGNIVSFTHQSSGTTSTPGVYNVDGTTNGHGESSIFEIIISGGTVSSVSLGETGNQYEVGDTIIISGNEILGQTGVIDAFTLIDNPTGLGDGTYTGLTVSGGSGSNALFDIDVFGGGIFAINLNDGGSGYIIGNTVSIIGSYFGGTNSVNDVTITVDSIYSDDVTITITEVSEKPSVYEMYNCNIFKRGDYLNRLSYYDNDDILNIKEINK